MKGELTTVGGQLTTRSDSNASLLDMRIDAKRFPRICTYTREQAVFEMTKIVSQAFLYKGQMADPKNIQFISSTLVDELQSDPDRIGTKGISFAEISRIVKRAVLQDEMYGISVASIFKVIAEYVNGEGKELHRQALEMKWKREEQELKDSIVAPMIQSYTGRLLKNSKV